MGYSVAEALSLAACVDYSVALAEAVRAGGFKPDLVVGIREGGVLPGHVVARHLAARFACLRVRRPTSIVKHSIAGRLLAWTGSSLYARSQLVRRLAELTNRGRGRSVQLSPSASPRADELRVLLVDDFCATGRTLLVACQILKSGRADLEVEGGALTVLPGREVSVYKPRFSVSTAWLSFPWSTDSAEYAAYERWKREHAIDSQD